MAPPNAGIASKVISARATEAEKVMIAVAAEKAALSPSQFVRGAAVQAAAVAIARTATIDDKAA